MSAWALWLQMKRMQDVSGQCLHACTRGDGQTPEVLMRSFVVLFPLWFNSQVVGTSPYDEEEEKKNAEDVFRNISQSPEQV